LSVRARYVHHQRFKPGHAAITAAIKNRVYKKAFSIEKAVGILEEGRGSHFDSELLGLFLAALPEILLIKEH